MFINVVPCEEDGNEDLNEDDLPEQPSDLLNQSISFKVKISHLEELPENFCRNMFCEYKFYMDDIKYTTNVSEGRNRCPKLNYEKIHHVECVTKFLIDYLLEDKLTIKIYGNQDLQKKDGKKKQKPNDSLNTSKSTVGTSNMNSSLMTQKSTNSS